MKIKIKMYRGRITIIVVNFEPTTYDDRVVAYFSYYLLPFIFDEIIPHRKYDSLWSNMKAISSC